MVAEEFIKPSYSKINHLKIPIKFPINKHADK